MRRFSKYLYSLMILTRLLRSFVKIWTFYFIKTAEIDAHTLFSKVKKCQSAIDKTDKCALKWIISRTPIENRFI